MGLLYSLIDLKSIFQGDELLGNLNITWISEQYATNQN